MHGYVYVIGIEGSSLVKIGMTGHPPEKRLAELQTGIPFRLKLLKVYPCETPKLIAEEKRIAHRLRLLRVERHLQQTLVAAQIGVTPKHLGHMENGKLSLFNVAAGTLYKLACRYEVSLEYLLGKTESPAQPPLTVFEKEMLALIKHAPR